MDCNNIIYDLAKNKSGSNMKQKLFKCSKLLFILAFFLMTAFAAAACQPTPKEEIVPQKTAIYTENEPEEVITKESLGIPEHIDETYRLGDKLTLAFDADVMVPANLDEYKVYRGTLIDFTQEQAESFAELFVDGVEMTAHDGRMTKDEIMENLILPAKKTLAELKAGTYVKSAETNSAEGEELTAGKMEETIKMYEQWLENAPEERSSEPVSIESYADNGNYFYGEFPVEGTIVTGKFAVGKGDRNFGELAYYNSKYELREPSNLMPDPVRLALPKEGLDLKTTPEQAVALAEKVKSSLGADELELFGVMQAEAWVESITSGKINAYYVVFTRNFDKIPVLYIPESVALGDYSAGQPFEKLTVTVDDSGVIAVNWMGNTKITDVLSEHPAFLSFDKILVSVKNQMNATDRYWVEQNTDWENDTSLVTSASLEYLRIKDPDGRENGVRFVPAWVFRGTDTVTYTDEALENNEYLTEKTTASNFMTPIVINALDGSFFDPRFLDGISD